ncbi:hypothetical protein UG55_100318 [Frankia sp. EI5c]|uniref:hypothetical protein n=1 Tax=Frankia sp. EI5c TaxID=683316 RepID=UPI0007C358AE|nr:hypothetical protein [Frankia sp. EI5c]OAA29207.1 hypothetical protein UG55_100318 [Frankia sp. EI5c]
MGGDIEHDGDALVRHVPMLATFEDDLVAMGSLLLHAVTQHRFTSDDADEMSRFAEATVQQYLAGYGQIQGGLAKIIGLQGGRLNLASLIGEATESETTGLAGGWHGTGGTKG